MPVWKIIFILGSCNKTPSFQELLACATAGGGLFAVCRGGGGGGGGVGRMFSFVVCKMKDVS